MLRGSLLLAGAVVTRTALCVAALTIAAPTAADVTAPSGKVIDCYCTDRSGARVDLGNIICLQVDGRMFLAQCQMSLNVPMWRELSQGCHMSSLPQSKAASPLITALKAL